MNTDIKFSHRYQPGFKESSMQRTQYTDDDLSSDSYEIIVRLIQEFHTKRSQLDKINHMTKLFQEISQNPCLIQNHWKFNCSIKMKIMDMRMQVKNFMDDKKRYRKMYSIIGAMNDKTEQDSIRTLLKDAIERRRPLENAFYMLSDVMDILERIVDESEKSAFTIKLLKDQQIFIVQE